MALATAETLRDVTAELGIDLIYKSSFDKANRTSQTSARGPGRERGLQILNKVRSEIGVPVLTDVHSPADVCAAAEVVDVLQTPAFLCRQTDLIEAAAQSGKPVNIKKGQFLSPWEMQHVVAKAEAANAGAQIMVCERGASFGYNNLIVDMRSLQILRECGRAVVFDATHSVQLPGAAGGKSGGQREFVPALARAAAGVGVDGLFIETHPEPEKALSDGANSWPLGRMRELLRELARVDDAAKKL